MNIARCWIDGWIGSEEYQYWHGDEGISFEGRESPPYEEIKKLNCTMSICVQNYGPGGRKYTPTFIKVEFWGPAAWKLRKRDASTGRRIVVCGFLKAGRKLELAGGGVMTEIVVKADWFELAPVKATEYFREEMRRVYGEAVAAEVCPI